MFEPSFNDATAFTLQAEGILSDHPNDKGGLTKYGITAATWATYCKAMKKPVSSVATITVADALAVYHLYYWEGPKIAALPRELQGPAFDFLVNSGRAIKILQGLLGVAQDGELGPVTLDKMAHMQAPQLRKLRNDYVTARIVYLADLCQREPGDIAFIEGWMRRVTKLYDFAY